MRPSRLNTIVDGIFAIAMTLLVLDLPRPSLTKELVHDLEIEWDAYVAYIVSFATLGVVWLEHHGMMIAVRRTSRRFINEICEGLVPALQRRGLVREVYTQPTLRQTLREF